MKIHNKQMVAHLKARGIIARAKYIEKGSLKGFWRLYNLNITWWDNVELQQKLKNFGFTNWDGTELSNCHGNGGMFHIFVKWNN